jgi:thioredoxin
MVTLSCKGPSSTPPKTNETVVTESQGKPMKLTKTDFLTKVFNYETHSLNEWKYLGNKPAIIDFYADWCAPCRLVAPVLAEFAAQYSDSLYVYKINVDQERELAALFGVNIIPSLLFIPMNDPPQIVQGALNKEQIQQVIDEFLLKEK